MTVHMHVPMRVTARQFAIGVRTLLVLTVLTGILYPLVVLGIGRLVAPGAAAGSPLSAGGTPVGSALLGQDFEHAPDADRWFWGRPSAANYDGLASGGSNLGPDNSDLLAAVEERRSALAAVNGVDPATVPADALTASGSGLDPDISPEYARLQVSRVAAARGLQAGAILSLVNAHVDGPLLGFIGAYRVNVLELNIALDQLKP